MKVFAKSRADGIDFSEPLVAAALELLTAVAEGAGHADPEQVARDVMESHRGDVAGPESARAMIAEVRGSRPSG